MAEFGAGILIHGEFAPGQQAYLGHGVLAALGVRVKGADGVDLVIEQIHTVGHGRPHGEEVNQPTAHGIFAVADHLRDMLVARQRQLGLELGFVQLLALLELKGVARQKRRRGQSVQRRGRRHQHHVGTAFMVTLANAPQRSQALTDQILVWRESVVGQGFPVREQGRAQLGCEEGHFVDQALRIAGISSDDDRQAASAFFAFGKTCQQQCIGTANGHGQGKTFTGREFGQVHGRRSF